jgi:hypothetical protein
MSGIGANPTKAARRRNPNVFPFKPDYLTLLRQLAKDSHLTITDSTGRK